MASSTSFPPSFADAVDRLAEITANPDAYTPLEAHFAGIDVDTLEGLYGDAARRGYRSRLVAHRVLAHRAEGDGSIGG